MCLRSGVGEASGFFHLGLGDGYPRLSRGPCRGVYFVVLGGKDIVLLGRRRSRLKFRVILRPVTAILKLYAGVPRISSVSPAEVGCD
jgi:hypothetical protein